MSVLNNSNAIESGGYNIDRSLRFRSSASAYLNRTPASAGNRKTWTWSGWVKRGAFGTTQALFGNYFAANDYSQFYLAFNTSNQLQVGLYTVLELVTNTVYRDPSSWYHIVCLFDTTQSTAANRLRLFVNGVEITSFVTDNRSGLTQNTDFAINAAQATYIGYNNVAGYYLDGYLAEVNFIDGQALTPSSFGETSTETGVWVPKKYTGTYGTNGFYLNFSDNTSATTLAYDKSGNGNNWTANNISTTAGATYDSMTDVPTLTSATAANYAVLNPINISTSNSSISSGNLNFAVSSASAFAAPSTFLMTSGKWYFEVTAGSVASRYPVVGVQVESTPFNASAGFPGGFSANGFGYGADGNSFTNNGPATSFGSTFTTGDIIGVAVDIDAGKVWVSKNNTWQASGNPSGGTSQAYTITAGTPLYACVGSYNGAGTHSINFGQRPFSYTPPTGFKALNTFNLPDPTIKKPNQYMDALTWTGTDSSTSRTFTGLNFAPDFVWVKNRTSAYDHALYDTARGAGSLKMLNSNKTIAESGGNAGTYGYLSAFNSDGYTFTRGSDGSGANPDGYAYYDELNSAYVGWQWKESATAGFDIVTYNATGSTQNLSHNLGVAPAMMIVKKRTGGTARAWAVYHQSLGNTKWLVLNQTDAAAVDSGMWNNTSPTSSVFTVGNSIYVNESGGTYVAYLFAEIPGFSKFGSFSGNGNANGPMVYLGFRPKYVMIKRTDVGGGDWCIHDTSRATYNLDDSMLGADISTAEQVGAGYGIDVLSNGFKLRSAGTGQNANGGTMIYAAFAEAPFKYALGR